jgi:hypothetical protein
MEAPQVNNQPQFFVSACSSNGCVRFRLVDVWMEGDAQAIVSTLQSNGDCPDKYRSFINYRHMQEGCFTSSSLGRSASPGEQTMEQPIAWQEWQ